VIDVSVKSLEPKMQWQYECLAVLLDDVSAPLPILQTLWNVGEPEARRVSRRLVDLSLAKRDDAGTLRLHDLQLDYARAVYADRKSLQIIHDAMRLSWHVIGSCLQ